MRSKWIPFVAGMAILFGVAFLMPDVLMQLARRVGLPTGVEVWLPIASITNLVLIMALLLASRFWHGVGELLNGFSMHGHSRDALAGCLVAVLILSLSVFTLQATGMLVFQINQGFSQGTLLYSMALMVPVAVGEEFAFRGYLQRFLQKELSPAMALTITSVVFMLLHVSNPFQQGLGLAGIFSGGLLLGVNFAFTKNLWFGIAMHWVWNVAQGSLLGFAVSGVASESLLIVEKSGSDWLTGGRFGLEGSILCILLNLAMAIFLFSVYTKKMQAAMKEA